MFTSIQENAWFYCRHYVFQLLYIVSNSRICNNYTHKKELAKKKKMSANVYIVLCAYLTLWWQIGTQSPTLEKRNAVHTRMMCSFFTSDFGICKFHHWCILNLEVNLTCLCQVTYKRVVAFRPSRFLGFMVRYQFVVDLKKKNGCN